MTRARILADYVSSGDELALKAPLASPAFTGTPTGITAAHITSGVLPVGVTGGSGLDAVVAGKILQVVFNSYNSANSDSNNTTTFSRVVEGSNYNWTGQITNVGASNHVLINMTFTFSYSITQTYAGGGFGIFRETTAILTPSEISFYEQDNINALKERYKQVSISFIDESPATGTNNYYLGYVATGSTPIMVRSTSGHLPFVCILKEIAQ